ncbi:toxin-antitoxin system YwqK family antitoxin [Pseudomonas indica]|uniref:toxin-antitoxin system YwqK family antitoxin n=1 Tax=Pseudomonas indica TaxID=137658 RepID=UPI003FD5C43F
MHDGKPSGSVTLRRGDAQLNGTLRDGALDGPVRIDDSGRPLATLSYRLGSLHGPLVMLHPNGKPSARLNYANDRLHGPASFYAEQGWLLRQANYRDGLLHGEVKTYFSDGTLAELEHYHAGQLHGLYQRFHANGRTALRCTYRQGVPVEPKQGFAEDGRPLDDDGKPVSRLTWWWRRWGEASEV